MSESSDSLHFDGVSLVKRVVEDARSVDNLPLGILVLTMTNKKVLSRECIGLNIYVCICHIVNERRLADIGETGNNESASVRVDLGQTAEMLSDFF